MRDYAGYLTSPDCQRVDWAFIRHEGVEIRLTYVRHMREVHAWETIRLLREVPANEQFPTNSSQSNFFRYTKRSFTKFDLDIQFW